MIICCYVLNVACVSCLATKHLCC